MQKTETKIRKLCCVISKIKKHACTVSFCVSTVSPLTCYVSMCLPLQSRSPKHGPSPQPSVGDQVDHLSLASLESLDTMSEADAPTGFIRGSRVRASLPVVRSTNQTKDRSLGMMCIRLLGWWKCLLWIRLCCLLLTTKCGLVILFLSQNWPYFATEKFFYLFY